MVYFKYWFLLAGIIIIESCGSGIGDKRKVELVEKDKKRVESPLEDLPAYIRQVTHFGERADWSHDGRFMAFQVARLGDQAGVGRGILVFDLGKYK